MKMPVNTTDKTSSFYYYCPIGDNNKEKDKEIKDRVRKMILGHEIYYKTKDQVNDPFEFIFNVSFEATTEEKIRKYAAFLQKNKKLSEQGAIALASSEYIGKTSTQLNKKEKGQLEQLKKVIDNIGFFSLSEISDSLLLWSHYADNHRGICIEFTTDISKTPHILWDANNQNAEPSPIIYSEDDTFPIINFYKDDWENIVRKIFLTKSKHWKYESEFRSIQPKQSKGYRKIPAGLISGVILGLKTTSDDEEFVRKIVKQSSTPIRIGKAAMIENHYKLEIKSL